MDIDVAGHEALSKLINEYTAAMVAYTKASIDAANCRTPADYRLVEKTRAALALAQEALEAQLRITLPY